MLRCSNTAEALPLTISGPLLCFAAAETLILITGRPVSLQRPSPPDPGLQLRTTVVNPAKLLVYALLLTLIGVLHTATLAAGIPAHLPVSRLELRTAAGIDHPFRISMATRQEDRQRGLMFVTEMAEDQGMLFDHGESVIASMWMKNTPLPLDMLFIRQDGTISSIARETVPYSRQTITSEEPVRAVLELKGGTCERLGVQPGDRVIHPIFESSTDRAVN